MLKEKLNKVFKEEGDNKKKIENLGFFLILLIVTVVIINVIWKDDSKKEDNNSSTKKLVNIESTEGKEEGLEEKLENILSNINGVGNVKVLITYNETEELVPIYNKKDKKTTTTESDSSGGTRVVEETDSSEEVVYQDDKIITRKLVSPKIEGAIITASGAGNSAIKTNIIQAVEAATRVSNT